MAAPTSKTIYDLLKPLGLTRAQARKLLPEWWGPEMESSPSGSAELRLLLSRRLSLDVAALSRGELARRDAQRPIAYKHHAGDDPTQLQASTAIATALAGAVISAMPEPQRPIPAKAEAFAALARKHGGVVGLASLIDACWELGVPVIPMPNLPVGVRKMDGAALQVGDRKAIIVSRKKSSRAWLAFIVAHEIGHLARGHLLKGGAIIDVSLQEQATYEVESSGDQQEREADEFALDVMGGANVEALVSRWPSHASPIDLAVAAKENAGSYAVEPGHLILRFAFRTKRWTEAVMALNYLREDADAEVVMHSALRRHLNFDLVADDMGDFIRQVTGIG